MNQAIQEAVDRVKKELAEVPAALKTALDGADDFTWADVNTIDAAIADLRKEAEWLRDRTTSTKENGR